MADNVNNIDISWEGHTGAEVEDWIRRKLGEMDENPIELSLDISEDTKRFIFPTEGKLKIKAVLKINNESVYTPLTLYAASNTSSGNKSVLLGTLDSGQSEYTEIDIQKVGDICTSGSNTVFITSSFSYTDPASGKTYTKSASSVITIIISDLSLDVQSYWYSEALTEELTFTVGGKELSKTLSVTINDRTETVELSPNSSSDVSIGLAGFNLTNGERYGFVATLSSDGFTPINLFGQFIYGEITTPYVLVLQKVFTIYSREEVVALEYSALSPSTTSHPLIFTEILGESVLNTYRVTYNSESGIPAQWKVLLLNNVSSATNFHLIAGYDTELSLDVGLDYTALPARDYIDIPNPTTQLYLDPRSSGYTPINFDYVSDGYIVDENVLRVRGVGSSLVVPGTFFSSGSNGCTLTVRFKMFNIRNLDSDVINYSNGTAQIHFSPNELYISTSTIQSKNNHNALFGEDVVNYFTLVYTKPYLRIYLNGCICREFKVNDMGSGTGTLTINSNSADVDIYSVLYYNTAFTERQVIEDYSTVLTGFDRTAFLSRNSIMVNNTINFDSVKTLQFNYIEVDTGSAEFPSYAAQGKGKKEITAARVHIVPTDTARAATFINVPIRGQGTSSMNYPKWNIEMRLNKIPDSGYWYFDNAESEHKGKDDGYSMTDFLPAASKLVWKLNWASSMQSHKMSMVNLYDELRKKCVDGMPEDKQSNVRSSVYQEPFFLFVNDVFYGLVTFGPGKGDSATFGDDGNLVMLEGRNNTSPLIMHKVPWPNNVDPKSEIIVGEGGDPKDGSWEFDFIPEDKQGAINHYKEVFNFAYYHNLRIMEWTAGEKDITDTEGWWYLKEESDTYKLLRKNHDSSGGYKNVFESGATLDTITMYDGVDRSMADALNSDNKVEAIKDLIKRDFAEKVANYFNVEDLQFTMMFLRLFNVTDNRGKNTYLYSRKVNNVWSPINFMQDDLDTMLFLDNLGAFTKPYYNTEHTKINNEYQWSSEANVLYNTAEVVFGESDGTKSPLENMMFRILDNIGGFSSIKNILFKAQNYFPEVAYNITANILYKQAAINKDQAGYPESADFYLGQSLGRQKEAEEAWFNKRYYYMSSYAQYGRYGITQSGGSGEAAGALNLYNATTNNTNFVITGAIPNKYIYPSVYFDRSIRADLLPEYVQSSIYLGNTGGTSGVQKYYRGVLEDFYNMGDLSLAISNFGNSGLDISNSKLHEFKFENTNGTLTRINLNGSILLEVVNLSGATNLTSIDGLSSLVNLRVLDLRNTSVNIVNLPNTKTLKEVSLGKPKRVYLSGCPNLSKFNIDDYSSLEELKLSGNIGNNSGIVLESVLSSALSASPNLNIRLDNVELRGLSDATLKKLINDANLVVVGENTLYAERLSFSAKFAYINKFAGLQNTIKILGYTPVQLDVNNVFLRGTKYISKKDTNFNFTAVQAGDVGNQFDELHWEAIGSYAEYVTVERGIVSSTVVGTEEDDPQKKVTIRLSIYNNGVLLGTVNKEVCLFERVARPGDYVYSDGTWSDELEASKTLIGLCLYNDADHGRIAVNPYVFMTFDASKVGPEYIDDYTLGDTSYIGRKVPSGKVYNIAEPEASYPNATIYWNPLLQAGSKTQYANYTAFGSALAACLDAAKTDQYIQEKGGSHSLYLIDTESKWNSLKNAAEGGSLRGGFCTTKLPTKNSNNFETWINEITGNNSFSSEYKVLVDEFFEVFKEAGILKDSYEEDQYIPYGLYDNLAAMALRRLYLKFHPDDSEVSGLFNIQQTAFTYAPAVENLDDRFTKGKWFTLLPREILRFNYCVLRGIAKKEDSGGFSDWKNFTYSSTSGIGTYIFSGYSEENRDTYSEEVTIRNTITSTHTIKTGNAWEYLTESGYDGYLHYRGSGTTIQMNVYVRNNSGISAGALPLRAYYAVKF